MGDRRCGRELFAESTKAIEKRFAQHAAETEGEQAVSGMHGSRAGQAVRRACPRRAIGNHPAMAILSDRWIREQALEHGMIEPFVESQRRDGLHLLRPLLLRL